MQRARVTAHVRLNQISEALSFIEECNKSAGEEKHVLQYEHAYVLYRLGMVEDALGLIRNEDTSSNVRSCKKCLLLAGAENSGVKKKDQQRHRLGTMGAHTYWKSISS